MTASLFIGGVSAVIVGVAFAYAVHLGWRELPAAVDEETEVEDMPPYPTQHIYTLQGFDTTWYPVSPPTADAEKINARVLGLRAQGDLRRYRVLKRTVTWEVVGENPDEDSL